MENANSYVIEQEDGSVTTLRDVQLACLEILEYFDAFCEKHNLRYTLCGGSCIGALRDNAFIPWDDDIDVHMFREDYEKLFRLWNREDHGRRLRLIRTTAIQFHDTRLIQISDQERTYIREGQKHLDIDHGIKIDVIPLDGAPQGKVRRVTQLCWALIYFLFNRGFSPNKIGVVPYWIGKFLLFVIPNEHSRTRIWQYAEKRMTRYAIEDSSMITEVCVAWKYMKILYPKRIFADVRKELFEGRYYPVPILAEEYLKLAFGDFRKLPPYELRVPEHKANFIDLARPYSEYRNTLYPQKNPQKRLKSK